MTDRIAGNIAYDVLAERLSATSNDTELFQAIVNAPFEYQMETTLMFLGIIVLLQVNPATNTIDRIALSQTEIAERSTEVSAVPFSDIRIDVNEPENILATAIKTGKMQDTTDWKYLFTPALKPEEARINQANSGIAYSAVHPLTARNGGAMIFSYYQYKHDIGEVQHEFMEKYVAVVNKQLSN